MFYNINNRDKDIDDIIIINLIKKIYNFKYNQYFINDLE